MEPDLTHTPRILSSDTETDNTRQWNPLSTDPEASRFSSYAGFNGTAIMRPMTPDVPIDAELIDAHNQLRQRVLDQSYPCTGAISAFSQHCYRFGLYPELACDSAVRAVCYDLYCFCHEFTPIDDNLVTFVAMFRGPAIQSERHFEDLLWNQLQGMHALDSGFFTWDKDVESDPASDRFSYSIAGRAMFVIGMHPKASRLARTFPYPTLVFNLHEQFEGLRARGKLEAMKQTIQAREMASQGSINPMLADFGENSEARQYSGRAVSENWVCPFHARKKGQTRTPPT